MNLIFQWIFSCYKNLKKKWMQWFFFLNGWLPYPSRTMDGKGRKRDIIHYVRVVGYFKNLINLSMYLIFTFDKLVITNSYFTMNLLYWHSLVLPILLLIIQELHPQDTNPKTSYNHQWVDEEWVVSMLESLAKCGRFSLAVGLNSGQIQGMVQSLIARIYESPWLCGSNPDGCEETPPHSSRLQALKKLYKVDGS